MDISPSAFGVDDCGNIYLTGWGGSFMFCTSISTMPILNPIQANPASSVDYYIMGLSQNLSSILFGSYFGGSLSNEHVDGGTSRISKNGILYQSVCSGCSGNDDFPVTPGAWPNTPGNQNHSFNCNNGVFKFDFQPNICNANFISNGSSSCAPVTYSLNNTSSNYLNWHWQFNPGNITSTLLNPTQSYTNAGNYTITLVVTNSLSCNLSDSVSNFLSIPLCTDVNQNNKSLNSFLVYPNPTSGFIYVIPQVYSSGLISIELYNVMGQKILLQNIMVTYDKIDINSFENGIYYLKIMTKEGQEVLKIVKD